jgi:uncharacterized membrane protein YdbT with pleckstrin-like domain
MLKFKHRFTGQKDGEVILLVLRRHWFNVFVQFIPILIVGGLLCASYLYLPTYFSLLDTPPFYNFFVFLESLVAMFVAVLFFLTFVDYFLDTWIITDQRIVNIEQRGLFCRVISELALDKIQDITTEITGVLPTFFNYGDVFIQTAAEKERFVFRKIPDPERVKEILMRLQKEKRKEKNTEFQQMIHEELE